MYMICENLQFKINDNYLRDYLLITKKYWKKLDYNDWYYSSKKHGIITHELEIKEYTINNHVTKWSKQTYPFKQLKSIFDNSTITRMIIKKQVALIPCGKCSLCMQSKKNNYKSRVKAQFKKFSFNYLLTITLNDHNIDTLINDQVINTQPGTKLTSYVSTLSKRKINNIIRNLKKKLNNFYKDKVGFHYFLCGEYGENTKRAHYHILLMLDKPLPNLKKKPIKCNYYDCNLLKSKQYGLFEIQLANNSLATCNYITKYLTKQSNKYNTLKYNLFMEEQFKYYKDNNISLDNFVFTKKEYYIKFLFYCLTNNFKEISYYLDILKNNPKNNKIIYQLGYMKEFIKSSRCLGINPLDYWENYNNKVLNTYYKNKLLLIFFKFKNVVLPLIIDHFKKMDSYDQPIKYIFMSYFTLFKAIENQRRKYYFSTIHKRTLKTKQEVKQNYQLRLDIF